MGSGDSPVPGPKERLSRAGAIAFAASVALAGCRTEPDHGNAIPADGAPFFGDAAVPSAVDVADAAVPSAVDAAVPRDHHPFAAVPPYGVPIQDPLVPDPTILPNDAASSRPGNGVDPCNPPYTIDAAGHKHYKHACLK